MSLRHERILITCGPTWIAIDPVRILSNCSTGQLGHLLADALTAAGARVTLLEGPVKRPYAKKGVKVISFTYFDELKRLLARELKKHYAVVVHAAAVADYRPKFLVKSKLPSGRNRMTLELVPTPKLIEHIKKVSPKTFLIGFKLETSRGIAALQHQSQRLIASAGCDLVVANRIRNGYRAIIVDKKNHIVSRASSRQNLVKHLTKILEKSL
jgi:phosphopantothenoylcysteine synthetase/decarboxylase